MPKVTVLTPTYNRARTLGRLYESLKRQDFRDFEWLVVDDGSTDGTAELVAGWIAAGDAFFAIRYLPFDNRGKHVALNRGVREARGEYLAMVDSDDWYPDAALRYLVRLFEAIPEPERSRFANVEGLCVDQNGDLIGSAYPAHVFDSDAFSIQWQRARRGDQHGMYRTAVLREFPFPEQFAYIRPNIVWFRIAERYRTRFVNAIVGCKEYLDDGLTRMSLEKRVARGEWEIYYFQDLLGSTHRVPFAMKREAVKAIACMALHHRRSLVRLFLDSTEKLLFLTMLPFAVAAYAKQRVLLALEARRRN